MSQNELEQFYEKLFSIYIDWDRADPKNNSDWNIQRYCMYQLGPIIGKYKENDPELLQIIGCDYSVQDMIDTVLPEIDSQIQKYERQHSLDIMDEMKYESYLKQHTILTGDRPIQWLEEYFEANMKGIGLTVDADTIMGFCIVYYGYLNYCKSISSVYNSDCNNLKNLYAQYCSKESSLYKYNMIDVVKECELMPIDAPRVYDKRIDKTMFTSNIPRELLLTISILKDMGILGNLAVRVSNLKSKIYDGRYDLQTLMEAKEFGKLFSINTLTSVPITKLYSKEYDDAIWIKITETDITFEELCKSDVRTTDSIVTQVIHLQYRKANGTIVISHIDHEFVFYDKKEYVSRKTNSDIKGTKHTRLKSFKIDNSMIPFDYNIVRKVSIFNSDSNEDVVVEEEVPFLIFVLKCYFKHEELIDEYFQNTYR